MVEQLLLINLFVWFSSLVIIATTLKDKEDVTRWGNANVVRKMALMIWTRATLLAFPAYYLGMYWRSL